MSNSYDYITIISDGESKHLGGNKKAQIIYNRDFFNKKNVILFDDVITRGNTIFEVKSELERMGANVICAITIGKTVHKRFIPDNWYDERLSMDNIFNNCSSLSNYLRATTDTADCVSNQLEDKISKSKVLYDMKNLMHKWA